MFGQYRLVVREVLRGWWAHKKPGLEIVEGNVCIDHVYLCLRVPPNCLATILSEGHYGPQQDVLGARVFRVNRDYPVLIMRKPTP
jgi:hypothetical protein